MNPLNFDAIVIGSGLAGLTYALHAAEFGKVAVLTKAELFESNTSYAQGGIAAAVGESDSWQLHEDDTLAAGAGLCDREAVRFLVQNAPAAIEWLASLGVRFDKNSEVNSLTEWALGREGGHSRNRIVHYADRTGWEIERAVNEAVRKNKNIAIYENTFVTNLLMHEGSCVGALAKLPNEAEVNFYSKVVMLATGGCGRLYQHTTNPRIATGDGIALGLGIGAAVADLEFMQFHPTTLYHPQMRSFLITEAARGEGGTLRNHLGDRFMYDFDEQLELAPRDIVARAIEEEMRRRETWCVYLDLTHLKKERILEHFPTIYEKLKSIGIEMHRHWIPIVPAQHYSCGGVVTNLKGETSISRLYAAGEVARTGVHGANRLASNSLLEALVFAKSAAAASRERIGGPLIAQHSAISPHRSIPESEAIRIRRALEKCMTEYVGIVRRNAGLSYAKERILELALEFETAPEAPYSQYSFETENLLKIAMCVVEAAMDRKVNVGLHYNADLVPTSPAAPLEVQEMSPKSV